MPGISTGVALAVSIGVSAVGTFIQARAQRKAAKAAARRAEAAAAERRRANALQQRRDDLVAARQRRRAVAAQRRARGRAVNLGAVRGVGGAIGAQGSTVPGVTGSLISQLNANNAFVNQVTVLNTGIRAAQTSAFNIAAQPISAGSGLSAFGGFLSSVAGPAGKLAGGINWGGGGSVGSWQGGGGNWFESGLGGASA